MRYDEDFQGIEFCRIMSERVRMNVVCTDEYDRNLLITAAIDHVAALRNRIKYY